MKRIGNLYEQIYDFENLHQAYLEARKGKRYRDDVLQFTANLEENLIQIQNELIYGTYKVGRYREFYVYEPKKRLIMALPFKDRVVQWAIYRVLNPLYEPTFIEHSYACRVGKGTHKAAAKLQEWLRIVSKKREKWYYLKLDISKYFYRVDQKLLINIVAKKVKDRNLLQLLWKIIRSEDTQFGLQITANMDNNDQRLENCGMPIGNLTSQLFANVYLNELDQFVKQKLGIRYYIRYMDDVIILHNNKKHLHKTLEDISDFLRDNLRLQLNNKTAIRPITLGIEFVGYRMWNTHKKLKKQTAFKMKKRLKWLMKEYAKDRVSLDTIKASLFSYLGILQHCNTYRLKRKVLQNFKLVRGRNPPRV